MAFQGTLKTTLSGAMSRVGSVDTARELKERGDAVTQDARSRRDFGAGAPELGVRKALEKASDYVREVGAGSGEGRNAGIPRPARPAPGVRSAPVQRGLAGPRVPGGSRARQPAPSRAGALFSSPSGREPRRS